MWHFSTSQHEEASTGWKEGWKKELLGEQSRALVRNDKSAFSEGTGIPQASQPAGINGVTLYSHKPHWHFPMWFMHKVCSMVSHTFSWTSLPSIYFLGIPFFVWISSGFSGTSRVLPSTIFSTDTRMPCFALMSRQCFRCQSYSEVWGKVTENVILFVCCTLIRTF